MLGMNVLVKIIDTGEKVSAGGIITPSTVQVSSIQKAKVVSIGPGEVQYGIFVKIEDVKADDVVLIDKSFAKAIDHNNEEHHIVSYRDVLGKI